MENRDGVVHKPVLLNEVLYFWHCKKGGFFIDATVGTGGHTEALLHQDTEARCLAVDCDPNAVLIAQKRLDKFGKRITLLKENYLNLPKMISELNFPKADGLLLDLGISSLQLESPERGFSFLRRGPLDMRMDPSSGETAADLIHRLSVNELADLIFSFGGERCAKAIAFALKNAQASQKLTDTLKCAEVIASALFSKVGTKFQRGKWFSGKLHPATKTFQALRIAVNKEMDHLGKFLKEIPFLLASGGRALFISFHSCEDRLVKSALKGWEKGALHPLKFRILTPKVIKPLKTEIERTNPIRSKVK